MTSRQRIAVSVVSGVVDMALFAISYLVMTAVWHANPVWAAGASVVFVLSENPGWGRS